MLAYILNDSEYKQSDMKKIVIVDGGPRKDMNTAQLLQRFAEGAKSVGEDIEVKTARLYDIDYKGCMSCMACKLKGKASNICRFRDALSPLLDDIAEADGLVLGSPIYFGEVTGKRALPPRRSCPVRNCRISPPDRCCSQ